jgi:hypothetical protein
MITTRLITCRDRYFSRAKNKEDVHGYERLTMYDKIIKRALATYAHEFPDIKKRAETDINQLTNTKYKKFLCKKNYDHLTGIIKRRRKAVLEIEGNKEEDLDNILKLKQHSIPAEKIYSNRDAYIYYPKGYIGKRSLNDHINESFPIGEDNAMGMITLQMDPVNSIRNPQLMRDFWALFKEEVSDYYFVGRVEFSTFMTFNRMTGYIPKKFYIRPHIHSLVLACDADNIAGIFKACYKKIYRKEIKREKDYYHFRTATNSSWHNQKRIHKYATCKPTFDFCKSKDDFFLGERGGIKYRHGQYKTTMDANIDHMAERWFMSRMMFKEFFVVSDEVKKNFYTPLWSDYEDQYWNDYLDEHYWKEYLDQLNPERRQTDQFMFELGMDLDQI